MWFNLPWTFPANPAFNLQGCMYTSMIQRMVNFVALDDKKNNPRIKARGGLRVCVCILQDKLFPEKKTNFPPLYFITASKEGPPPPPASRGTTAGL